MAPTEVMGAIERFRCCKNPDIEHFLKHSAINFEQRGLSTTYIYADEDTCEIAGYFSLTHKALTISQFSNGRRKDIGGSKAAEVAPFILLGQLGKRMECTEQGDIVASSLSGEEMLDDVFSIIDAANQYIINRRVLVECDNVEPLLRFYTHYGFRSLAEYGGKCALYLKLEPPEVHILE